MGKKHVMARKTLEAAAIVRRRKSRRREMLSEHALTLNRADFASLLNVFDG
jgi:hypothetical protein